MGKRLIFALVTFTVVATLLAGCATPTPAPVATMAPEPTTPPVPTATPVPPPMLGTEDNPLIMALAPSATTQELIASGDEIAKQLSDATGLVIKTTVPTSYSALVEAMGSGNAHIGWLPPLAYLLAKQKEYADVGLATIRSGRDHYPTQFEANVSSGFTPYFDPATEKSTADSKTALAQFEGKKPCWTDPLSASGYVIPSRSRICGRRQDQTSRHGPGSPDVVRAAVCRRYLRLRRLARWYPEGQGPARGVPGFE